MPSKSVESPERSTQRRRQETYSYFWGAYEFDVDRAWDLVRGTRDAFEVDKESVELSVEDSVINPEHVKRVDPKSPGLIAHIFLRDEQGTMHRGHVLIDGHHRAARCLKENRAFSAYLLTEEESVAVLIKSPMLDAIADG